MFKQILNYLNEDLYYLSQYKEANGVKALCTDQDVLSKMKSFVLAIYKFYDYE